MFIEFTYGECFNQDVKQKTTKILSMKVNDMNKKVMVLFASAVLTASLAATGCSYIKGANVGNFLPTANQSVAEAQETTGESTATGIESMAAAYGDVQQGKLAVDTLRLGVSYPGSQNPEAPIVKMLKDASSKKSSKKTTKSTKSTKKASNKASTKNTSKTGKATKKTSDSKKTTTKKSTTKKATTKKSTLKKEDK